MKFVSKVDIHRVEKQWAKRGFSCDLWVDPPATCWENFTHEVDELVMVVQGQVEFEIAGRVVRPPMGEEILIPAQALHSVRNVGNMESRWLYGYASQ